MCLLKMKRGKFTYDYFTSKHILTILCIHGFATIPAKVLSDTMRDGLFVITDGNYNQFIYFNNKDNTCHILIISIDHGIRNSLVCLSGSRTNAVERYSAVYMVRKV